MRKYELSISADYVPGWGVTEAVREFFQNSIDEETRDSSNKMLFEYDEAEEKLIIGNKHSELDIKTLLFGTTTKNDDDAMIGNHGEGYKIATVVLLRLGKTVVFNNYCRREVWRPRLVKSRKYDGALVPTFFVETAAVWEKVPDHSLMIEISGITPEEYEKAKKSNLHLQGDYQKIETMYGDILESPEHKGKIFVGGLYICEEPRLDIGVDFKPCYVRLERDRNMVNSFDVCWYASKMVENAQNAELLKKSIDSYSGQYIMCECVPEDLKNEIAEDFINEYGAKAAPVTDQKDMEQFDAFCTRVYTNGFNDGKKSATEKPVRTITDEQLMEVIGEVKGVGPALRGKIKEAIEAKFGSIGNGKKAEEQKGTAC